MDVSRRRFLRGHIQPQHQATRLPWAISEDTFLAGCTRCNQCLSACPQGIVKQSDGGFPALDFSDRECTFCGECVKACPEPLFDLEAKPWQQVAEVSNNCLTFNGIVCQNCKDACEPRAIRFQFSAGGLSRPEIDTAACTGCGACIAPCPNGSISMRINDMSYQP